MPASRYRGPPMTLANMRHNGVRSLSIRCELCHHEAVLNVDGYDEDVAVPSFGPRMHLLRHHRRRRAAQLERAATEGEFDRLAVAMKEIVREGSDGLALPDNIHSGHSNSQLVDRFGCRRRSNFAHLRLALSKSDR